MHTNSMLIILLSLTLQWLVRALTTSNASGQIDLDPNNAGPLLDFGNKTLGIPKPPRGYSVSYNIGGPKLNQTALLMNAVAALRNLALGDWDGKVSDGTEYKMDSCPQVSILVTTPKRLRSILVSVVVWAITVGVYHMIEERTIELSQFEIRLRDKLIGWVHIAPNDVPAGNLTLEGGNRSTNDVASIARRSSIMLPPLNSTQIGLTDLTTTINTDISNDDPIESRLATDFTPFGETLSIYDVFVPIMGGLAELARVAPQGQTQLFLEEREGYDGCICVSSTPLFRHEPPYLDFQWLARTIARIPSYMLSARRFGEIKMELIVDEVRIAVGRMGSKKDLDRICETHIE